MNYRNVALGAAIVALTVLSSVASRPVLADQDDHNGAYQQQYNPNGMWSNGRCYSNNGGYQTPGRGYNRDDRSRYDRNQSNNGQYPTYGPNGGSNCANAEVQGVIVGVNGSELIVQEASGRGVRVDDRPALDNRTSGHVYLGRSVRALGYWQNGIFYATQMN